MSLRFRKSVKICKGVKVNFGKTGASVTLGERGFHKTFHTSGRVTTSVGIPGTGIYWTESTNLNRKSGTSRNRSQSGSGKTMSPASRPIQPADNGQVIYNNEPDNAHGSAFDHPALNSDWNDLNSAPSVQVQKTYGNSEIKQIYQNADFPVDWIEISNSESSDEVDMSEDLWRYCKSVSDAILDGDIDTYLNAIETLRPIDDLLLYAGDFEFGTEKSNSMTVEFTVNPGDMLPDGERSSYYEEFINAVAIRVARDTMALLPVNKVEIDAVNCNQERLKSIVLTRKYLRKVNYRGLSATEIVNQRIE